MEPVVQPITIRQGDRHDYTFRVRERVWNATTEEWEAGDYVDLTGKTVRSQIRTTPEDPIVQATYNVVIMDQVTMKGGVYMYLLPTETAPLLVNGVYDVEMETTASPVDTETLIEGPVTVTKQVTRAA